MKLSRSEPGLLLSGGAHAAVLLAALLAFRTEPYDDASESVPVEVVSASQFAEMMKGEREAKTAAPVPKPRVDKVAEAKDAHAPTPLDAKLDSPAPPARPVEPDKTEPTPQPPTPPERPKAAEDQAVKDKATQGKAAQAEAEAKTARLEAEALERAKAEKAKEAKAKEERAKADAEAQREAKAKEAQKLAALAAEAAKPAPTPKPVAEKEFDPNEIGNTISKSRERPQAAPSTGAETNKTASLGSPRATGQRLNPAQREQLGQVLKEQLIQCWSPPPNMTNAENLKPRVRMFLNQDGTLSADPIIANTSEEAGFRPVAESAVRAVRKCAPFKIPEQFMPFYNEWRSWNVTFDAKEMLG